MKLNESLEYYCDFLTRKYVQEDVQNKTRTPLNIFNSSNTKHQYIGDKTKELFNQRLLHG